MEFELKARRVVVTYSFDESTNLYTICLLEKGGPVIVSKDLEEGKKEMDEAINFAFAVRNLQYFDDISLAKRASFTRTNSNQKNEVNYLELQTA